MLSLMLDATKNELLLCYFGAVKVNYLYLESGC